MQSNNVLQERILAMTFNHERSSIIYLSQPTNQGQNPINELIELDLHNQTVLERYIVSNQLPNQPPFSLMTSKRKSLLILTFQPSMMEIWQLGSGGVECQSRNNYNQSIWSGTTKGKHGYEVQIADVSNLDGTMFFSAVGQRNIYCANLEDTISSSRSSLNLSKLKLPLKVDVHDLKCHPCENKVFAACSDNHVRIWNQNTFTELIPIQDQNVVITMSFQQDGQKLLTGSVDGKIACWDGKTLGNRNILLAVYKCSESLGVMCLHWLNYNGALNSEDFLCYNLDGKINLMNLKLLVPQQMIRDQKISKSRKQELFGSLKEVGTLITVKNDLKHNDYRTYNIGLSRFIAVHPYANFVCLNSVKVILDQTREYLGPQNANNLFFSFNSQVILLNNKSNTLSEYPVSSMQYQYSLNELTPNDNNQILTQRYIYYIDQNSLEIKQYCLAKGTLKVIANLKNMVFAEDASYYQLNIRPNTLQYSKKLLILVSYKMQSTYRTITVMAEDGVVSDNVKEYPSRYSMFLGMQHWANPPLFLLYEDRQSYSLIFEESLPQEQEIQDNLSEADRIKLQTCMKQSLNLKVHRVFWTPLRHGFVVIYLPINENILRFSRNRIQENLITDFLLLSGQNMTFRLGFEETITDIVWQKRDEGHLAGIVCMSNVYIINDTMTTLKVISLLPQINKNNRVLLTYWMANILIVQTKFHILYVLLDGKCGAIQALDSFEDKNILVALLWDRVVILCQSHHKRANVEIKTKYVNLLQPILQGYLHNQKFLNEEISQSVVQQLISVFANSNVDFTLIKDLEEAQLRTCSKYIISMYDCKQFTLSQKAKYYMQGFDNKNLIDTVFGSTGMYNLDLQKQLTKKLTDPRYQYLRILMSTMQKYFNLSYSYKNAAAIEAILSNTPNTIISILAMQNKLELLELNDLAKQHKYSLDSRTTKLYQLLTHRLAAVETCNESHQQNNDFQLDIASRVDGGNEQSIYMAEIQDIATKLEEQQVSIKQAMQLIQICSENNMELEMLPSHYVTDILLDKLNTLRNAKPFPKGNAGFGEDKYILVYEDAPCEEDDDENIVNGRVIRYFDKVSYDSIVYFLGLGGQPVSKAQHQQQINKQAQVEEYDFGDEPDEFQDLLIYWRVDEGKGSQLEDLGNYECIGDIYSGSELMVDSDHCWERLEESEPMEWEDKWGKKCDPQCSFLIDRNVGFQTRKKQKHKVIEFFTIEMWINPISQEGQLLQIGDNNDVVIELVDSNISVTIQSNIKVKFVAQQQDDPDNQLNQPTLNLNRWNHVSLAYEQSTNLLSLYLNAKNSFQSQEIELPKDILKDKFISIGQTPKSDPTVKYAKFLITEFRVWKQNLSLNEIKDGFRTPLSIVSEKKKQLKMKFKEKKEANKGDLRQFIGMMAIDQEEPPQFADDKQIENIDDGAFQQQPEAAQSAPNDFGSSPFGAIQGSFSDFGSVQKPDDNPFGGFAQFEQPVTQVKQQDFGDWGSEFKQTDPSPTTPKQPESNQQILEIQKIVDEGIENFAQLQIQKGIENLSKAFDSLNEYTQNSKDKLRRIKKFIIHCAQYRFAFQLLIGIKQMSEQNNKKKEIYLYLILIHLNIKPVHRIHWIIKCIKKCIEHQNTLLGETLCQQLLPTLEKNPPSPADQTLFKECQIKLLQTQEKQNLGLMRLTCPNCQKHFHFKGVKKCSKCTKDFYLCSQTLSCVTKDKILQCNACELTYCVGAKKAMDHCPICKLGVVDII